MNIPSLYALRAFCYSARHLSYTQAAQVLCISQSAVSKHIRTLEDYFGISLFNRNGPQISLTAFGENLYRDLEQGFHQIEQACRQAQKRPQTLYLKSATSVSLYWLIPALMVFHHQNLPFRVSLNSKFMNIDNVDFQTEPFDMAVLCLTQIPHHLHAIKLFDECLQPVYSHNFISNKTHHDLFLPENLLHASEDKTDWQQWLLQYYPDQSINLAESGFIFDTLALAITAAVQDAGIALIDRKFLPDLQKHHNIITDSRHIDTRNSYYLVWPKNSPYHTACHEFGLFLNQYALSQ